MINFNSRAFTIVETLIASAIIIVVIAGSLSFYLIARSAWIDCSKRVPLQRKASLAMEKMVRGIDGRNGIREADAGSVIITDSDTKIEYTSGIDAKERGFFLNGSKITYDPDTDPLVTGDEFDMIPEKVSGLTFAVSGSIVTIDLDMHDKVRDTDINVNLSTKVKIRN